jgi:hypothetical protein
MAHNSLEEIVDVYGKINNHLQLNISYGSTHASIGSSLTQSQTSHQPTMQGSRISQIFFVYFHVTLNC